MFGNRRGIKIRHRLLTRLLLSYILIVSIPLFLTGRVLVNTAQDSIEKTILERNFEFARRSTLLIDEKLQTAQDMIRSQAKNPSIYEMNKISQELTINTIVTEFDIFDKISIIDTLGNVIASTSFADDELKGVSGNGMIASVLADRSYISDVYLSDGRLPMIDLAEPIKLQNEVVGLLYATVNLKAMWELVEENVVGKKGEAFIFDRNGLFIAHSDRKKVYAKQIFDNQGILQNISRGIKDRTIYRTDGDVEMVAAYAPIGNYGWGFMIQQPTSEAFEPARSMRLRILQFMIGSVLLASLLAFLYTKGIVKPVDHLVSGMEQFSKGDMNFRINKVSNDEIGTLAENFNEMADRLVEFQNTIKRTERLETLGKLASVLSHEIRNPLNSMVINMQILKREFTKEVVDKDKVEKFYTILAAEIKRVDRLVTDFLLIARPPKLEREKVHINEILDEVVLTQVAESLKKGVRIEREYEKKDVEAHVDVSKMKQVCMNLIKNAVEAMPGGGRLTIAVKEATSAMKSKLKLKGKYVVISFLDTGPGIPKSDLNKIFDFYYSTKKDGSGLGLAIVQQIVEEHQGLILVESTVGQGTVFTLYLPEVTKSKEKSVLRR